MPTDHDNQMRFFRDVLRLVNETERALEKHHVRKLPRLEGCWSEYASSSVGQYADAIVLILRHGVGAGDYVKACKNIRTCIEAAKFKLAYSERQRKLASDKPPVRPHPSE
jgi:hypothetical protein